MNNNNNSRKNFKKKKKKKVTLLKINALINYLFNRLNKLKLKR